MQVAGLGFAPPSPHELTDGMSASSRCQQCHVFQRTTEQFVANTFAGLRQDLRHGRRLNDLTPPVMPHKLLMRENCSACHTGAAAREEIRTSHPERPRCMQCHVPQETTETFATEYGPGS
jgi:cytochrome c-type protein NapB